MKYLFTFALSIALFVPAMAQDAAAGKVKFASCTACHGAQGQGGVGP